MLETLVEREPALLIPIVALLGATLVFTVWIIAHSWCKSKQIESELALKKDMLAREFAPADIERVLLASANAAREEASAGKEAISDNEYYLVEKMLNEEYPVEEIERLVKAFKSGERVAKSEEIMSA
jgi:hypothetical protein